MSLDVTNAYASIIKQEKQEDGTLLVYGKATDDAIDSDNQICDAGWLEKAMPEWFKTGGNIREQHSNIAAGVAKELDSKSDGHYISALVVDPVSVKKIEAGVLKGFSIGIRSPRVVRDNKAANGRIIDGTIVEVSLVDRPANPNAKLMLAKSEGTEVIQVEELIEAELPQSTEEAVQEVAQEVVAENAEVAQTENKEEAEAVKAVIALSKSLNAETKKFDAATYETARAALARLIQIEAKEMEEGNDESFSLYALLCAVNNLVAWFEHEKEEGEVAEVKEDVAEEVMEADKSANKCLDCGCHKPTESHGRNDVSTAEMLDTEKSVDTIIPDALPEVITTIDESEFVEDEEDSTSKSLLANVDINNIIEKAVQSAKEAITVEIESLKSAKEAVEAKVVSLEADLTKAKSQAVGGGPRRTTIKSAPSEANVNAVKAAELFAKAEKATDPLLVKGYKELANDFLSKSLQA